MPVVDDDGNEVDVRKPWSLQSEQAQLRTISLIEMHRPEMEQEYGAKFKYSKAPSGRVIIYPVDDSPRTHRC